MKNTVKVCGIKALHCALMHKNTPGHVHTNVLFSGLYLEPELTVGYVQE